MKLFVISLREAAARRAAAIEQFEQTGLEFQFFDALHGPSDLSSCSYDIDRKLYRLNTLRDPFPAEIGCYASHLELWKSCVELNEPIVILEDDFQLGPDFPDVISKLKTLVKDYGFIRLESCERKSRFLKFLRPPLHPVPANNGVELCYVSDVPLCALAYAISPSAASSLVNASAILIAPVDKFLQKTWVHNTPIFAIRPPVVRKSCHAGDSTIGTRQQKSLSPWLLFKRALYKASGELRRDGFDKKQLVALGIRSNP